MTNARISVRRLSEADAEAYVSFRRDMLAAAPFAFGASPEDDFASEPGAVLEQLRRGDDSVIFGAFDDDDHLVGSVGMFRDRHRKASHKMHVWGMFVATSHRGRGIGRRLLDAAVAHARSRAGVTRVDLSVSSDATAARRMYQLAGFASWGVEPDALRIDSRSIPEEHMVLPLGEATPGDRDAVIAVAERMFAAMRDKDESSLRALMHENSAFVSWRTAQREVTRRSGDEFVRGVLSNPAKLEERMFEPRVESDGPLATLRAPYDFHIDGRFSHRGTDVFVFLRESDGWKLVSATYTVESQSRDSLRSSSLE